VDQFSAEKNTIFEKSHVNIAEPDGVKAGPVTNIKKADFGLAAFNDEGVKKVSEPADGLLNFDLTSFEDDVLDDEWKNNESIDFDSGALTDIAELDKAREDIFWKSQEVAHKDEFESLDFDLSAHAVKAKEIGKIDLSVVNDIDEGYQNIEFATDKPAGLNDSILNDPLESEFEFEFDMPVVGLYGQDSELTDMDELETKLDLAMAYIDMNDSDAAEDIAREVLEKGSPEQQMTAQTMLDRLK
jgi:pilus assembly protein FimV